MALRPGPICSDISSLIQNIQIDAVAIVLGSSTSLKFIFLFLLWTWSFVPSHTKTSRSRLDNFSLPHTWKKIFPQAMANIPSKAVVIAICAAVGAVVFAAGSFFVIKLLHSKYKRLPAITSGIAERRLSRYSGSHFTFTDADFARTPGTRAKLRRPINSPYSSLQRDWATIPSCENVQRRAALPRTSKALVADEAGHDPNAGPRWPLPPRLKRTHPIPLSAIKKSPFIQYTERTARHADIPTNKAQVPEPVQRSAEKHTEHNTDPRMTAPSNRSLVDSLPEAVTRPKPLFYGKQRSSSTGIIVHCSESGSDFVSAGISQATQPQSESLLVRRSSLPRSSSLFTQQPGQAPSIPMPELPPEVYTQMQKFKVPKEICPKRPSGVSLVSDYTSLMDDETPRARSHTDTDCTSVGLQSLSTSDFALPGLGIEFESGMWESATDVMGGQGLCTQICSQQSLGPSIHHSLPRDNSSGLRFSMYDHNQFRNDSNTTLSNDISPKPFIRDPVSANRGSLGQEALPPNLPPRSSPEMKIYESSQIKRTSKSILKDVSGNEGSPLKWESRPSSTIASDLFHIDAHGFLQRGTPSAVNGSVRKHKTQSYVRPPTLLSVVTPEPNFPAMAKGIESTPAKPPIPGQPSQATISNQATSRSASKAKFSPLIDPLGPRDDFTGNADAGSPTLSVMRFYKHDDHSSSDSIAYTPTRKPSGRNPSAVRPENNRKSMFLSLNPYDPESAPNLPIFPNLAALPLHSNHAETSPPSSKHSFLQFPDPPKSFNPDSWRRTPLHGPRKPPRPSRSLGRCSPIRQSLTRSQSPSKAGVGKSTSSPNSSPRSKQLLNTIMSLRRMNSDVSESRSEKAHGRFRSLGSAEETLGKGEGGSEERGQEEHTKRLVSDMRTPRHLPELEIPGLLSSNQRKQQDIWKAPKWAVAGSGYSEVYGEDGFLLKD